MRAAVFEGEGRLVVRDLPEPIPGADEVLIEVEACGVCASDVKIISLPPAHPSNPPVVLGHEIVGRIKSAGSTVRNPMIGTRVVVDPDPKCGECIPCRSGKPAYCKNILTVGVDLDGGLAEFVVVKANSVYPIADDIPTELAVLAEPLAEVVSSLSRADLKTGDTVVVFGGGAVGCLFTAVLRASGAARIVVIEPQSAWASVAEAAGADFVVTPEQWAAQRAELMPDGADVIVDSVGASLPNAIDAAGIGARVILYGMYGHANAGVPQGDIVGKSLSIFGVYMSNFAFPAAVRLIESGRLNIAPIVAATVEIDHAVSGIDRIRTGDAMKIVFKP